jgi:uncharacterized C2H2 Zn-finger protein
MFLFIGGIQPRTVDIGEEGLSCPRCSRRGVALRRTDHYFSLFFIPLFRVRKGAEFYQCGDCGCIFTETGEGSEVPSGQRLCRGCGRESPSGFSFCPYCGRPLTR